MKNIKFKPLNLLYNILVLAFLFANVGINVGFAIPVGFMVGIALGFVRFGTLSFFMPLNREIWESDIKENLYADNTFLKTFTPADPENINGRTVTIPNAGAAAAVQKNRTELPATVTERTDVPTSYQIAEFTSDPRRVAHAETVELSYDKRQSILRDDRKKINEVVVEDLLLSVVKPGYGTTQTIPSTSILLTVGANTDATAPGATGSRKSYGLGDLQRARAFFITQDSWSEGNMYALINAQAEVQMFPAESQITATYMTAVSPEERAAGVMYKAYGFKIMTRSSVYVFDNAGAFKPKTASGATTDDEGVLFYNGTDVEFALGDIKVFDNPDRAEWYSDIMSQLLRAGGRAMRENFEGMLIIKQAKGS